LSIRFRIWLMTIDWNNNLAIFLNPNHQPHHPSVRLRRLNIRKPLRQAGIKADLVYRYEDLWQYSNILISHLDKKVAEYCHRWRCQGRRLFYDHTEGIWGLPYQEEVFNLCDYIVCCSTKLAEITQEKLTSSFTQCVVIPDMLEGPRPIHQPRDRERLTCVWTGMGGNSYLVKELKPLINNLDMDLIIISEHADADIKWNRDTYLYDMAEADIVLCPQNVERQPAKSHVKVATAMALGMPVVCSPNPAYIEIVKHGVNGFIARDRPEWAICINELKKYEIREKFSQEALKTSKQFEPTAIAEHWNRLLQEDAAKPNIAFINNTLPHKYVSYGDIILDILRLQGNQVTEYRYEDVDFSICDNHNMYIFIEVRYDPSKIHNKACRVKEKNKSRILLTQEDINLNHFAYFDLIVTVNSDLAQKWKQRGFVNIVLLDRWESINATLLQKMLKEDSFLEARKKHNFELHSKNIDSFHQLQPPEERWSGGARDQMHIQWTMEQTHEGADVLDVGSADGWLSLYLALNNRRVSAMEFVDRGIKWAREQAKRLAVEVDLREGFIESVDYVFKDKLFDFILLYEILEHLDYRRVLWYCSKLEGLLKPGGKMLITLPKQDLLDNPEHLWSPSQPMINNLFFNKHNFKFQWKDIPDHGIAGNWFISYSKEK